MKYIIKLKELCHDVWGAFCQFQDPEAKHTYSYKVDSLELSQNWWLMVLRANREEQSLSHPLLWYFFHFVMPCWLNYIQSFSTYSGKNCSWTKKAKSELVLQLTAARNIGFKTAQKVLNREMMAKELLVSSSQAKHTVLDSTSELYI